MEQGSIRFDRFTLDPRDRSLCEDGVRIELNARYLDALILLVGDAGRLVSKDRFMAEVWRGIPVTDEALTQCIRTLRRTLGDSVQAPRFIETVPRHGYRFVAPVEAAPAPPRAAPDGIPATPVPALPSAAVTIAATTVGGALAGVAGGLVYGFAGAAQPLLPGTGASAVVLVLLCVTLVMACVGAIGVGGGIAAAMALTRARGAIVAGGAIGGFVTGAVVRLLGTDLFALLFGQSPGAITGAVEGLVLGGATGGGVAVAQALARTDRAGRGVVAAAGIGGTAGAGIALAGGRLLGGSLASLADAFPASRLRLDAMGAWFGEPGFGPVTGVATAALEGALFAGCIAAMLARAQRRAVLRPAPLA